MENKLDFETFVFISSKKIIISVLSKNNQKVYDKEFKLDQNSETLNFEELDYFLNQNIFKIEKNIRNFVKKINIILESEIFFSTEISLKKIDYENLINFKTLNYLLSEAKDCCKKTIGERKIIHMIINNYQINDKSYQFMPSKINSNIFSIDVKFISISTHLIRSLEKVFKKYQISLGQVVSANYVKKFLDQDEKDIIVMAKKIMNGYNSNEVLIVDKSSKNQGFFEKFFNFFN